MGAADSRVVPEAVPVETSVVEVRLTAALASNPAVKIPATTANFLMLIIPFPARLLLRTKGRDPTCPYPRYR